MMLMIPKEGLSPRAASCRRPRRSFVSVSLLFLLTTSCSQRELFVPAEHATGFTPHGYRAAEYEVQDAEGSIGDVKIWSKGTLRKNLRGSKETFVHVAFSIDNQTRHPMRLERQKLSLKAASDDGPLGPLAPTLGKIAEPVRAGKQRSIEAWFALPDDVRPDDVRAFRVSWTVDAGQATYSQRTPFLQATRSYYYSPYFDPFHNDPMVVHSGVIVHGYPYFHRPHPPNPPSPPPSRHP